jgi:hypothetical protein
MNALPLDMKTVKELLNKGWMTHDAMWFYNCLQEVGIERTNKINRAAVRAMAALEIKRLRKALGVDRIETWKEFRELFEAAGQVYKGEFMQYRNYSPATNVIRAEWISCFAYEGVKALGVLDRYECGIMERIESWLDTLGVKWEVEPKVTGCMMHTEGRCYREYHFFFPE